MFCSLVLLSVLLWRSPRRTCIPRRLSRLVATYENVKSRNKKKRQAQLRLSLFDFVFCSGLRLLFAEQAAELVDGIRGGALASAGERSGRIGYPARSSAASAGKFRLEKAGGRATDVRH